MNDLKAYVTQAAGIFSAIVTMTPGAARSLTARSARENGYPSVSFTSVVVTRAPEYDKLLEPMPCGRQLRPNELYSLEYCNAPCRCTKCEASRAAQTKED